MLLAHDVLDEKRFLNYLTSLDRARVDSNLVDHVFFPRHVDLMSCHGKGRRRFPQRQDVPGDSRPFL